MAVEEVVCPVANFMDFRPEVGRARHVVLYATRTWGVQGRSRGDEREGAHNRDGVLTRDTLALTFV